MGEGGEVMAQEIRMIREKDVEENWKRIESVLSDRIKEMGPNRAVGAWQTGPSPVLSWEN